MRVLKFGGTSVGDAQRMKQVANIVSSGEQSVIVLSAMSKTTNSLLNISKQLKSGDKHSVKEIIEILESRYKQEIKQLFIENSEFENCKEKVANIFSSLYNYLNIDYHTVYQKIVE